MSQVKGDAAFVSLQDVLNVLESLRVKDSELIRSAGLSHRHPDKDNRLRFEMFRARCLALDIAAAQVAKLPLLPADNLMGKKPILEALEERRAVNRRMARQFAARSEDPLEQRPDFCESEWNRRDAVACELRQLIDNFSGSAEEQPEPREESRPPIGMIPVTAAGANLPAIEDCSASLWLEHASIAEIEALSESCLEALERREGESRWQSAS